MHNLLKLWTLIGQTNKRTRSINFQWTDIVVMFCFYSPLKFANGLYRLPLCLCDLISGQPLNKLWCHFIITAAGVWSGVTGWTRKDTLFVVEFYLMMANDAQYLQIWLDNVYLQLIKMDDDRLCFLITFVIVNHCKLWLMVTNHCRYGPVTFQHVVHDGWLAANDGSSEGEDCHAAEDSSSTTWFVRCINRRSTLLAHGFVEIIVVNRG